MEQPKTWAPLGLSQGPRARKFFGEARWSTRSHRIDHSCRVCLRPLEGAGNQQLFCDAECAAASTKGWEDNRDIADWREESLSAVGQLLGISRERVSQIETNGMRKMLLLLNDLSAEVPGDEVTGLSPAEQRELVYLKERERELGREIAARSPKMAESLGIAKARRDERLRPIATAKRGPKPKKIDRRSTWTPERRKAASDAEKARLARMKAQSPRATELPMPSFDTDGHYTRVYVQGKPVEVRRV